MRPHSQRHPSWLALLCAAAGFFLPISACNAAAAAGPHFDVSRFEVRGNTLLPPGELESLLAPYKGSNREFGDLQRALAALQDAYAKQGYNLVRVVLPEQELNQGIVRLDVVETRIGRVAVEGNRFFSSDNIRRSVPGLREGETPNILRISASLAQANENPAKKTSLKLQSAAREGEVEARLAVADEKPWRVGLNVDNTGNSATGRTLVGLTYQNANLAGRDDVLGLQYTTTAEKPERVSVYGAGYHIPFYALGDSLDVYANYSDVDSGTVLAGIFDLQVSGKGTVFGTRYNHAFGHAGPVDSSLSLGFDHKAYRNGVELQGIPLGNDVTLHPLSLSYWGTWKAASSDTSFTLTAVRNLPGGRRGDAEDFARVRSTARASYSLLRYGVVHSRALPADWQLRVSAMGQYTRDSLVPGEQFGIGGMGSVRGFLTREIASDQGYSGSVEAYTPDLCGRIQRAATFCRLLAFYDGAHVRRNDALPGEIDRVSIGSVGVGLRAVVGRYATLQLDYGYVVDGGGVEARGDNRVNFKLSLSY